MGKCGLTGVRWHSRIFANNLCKYHRLLIQNINPFITLYVLINVGFLFLTRF